MHATSSTRTTAVSELGTPMWLGRGKLMAEPEVGQSLGAAPHFHHHPTSTAPSRHSPQPTSQLQGARGPLQSNVKSTGLYFN